MFIPGSSNPRALDQAMRTSLAASLSHILSRFGTRLNVSADQAGPMIANIENRRVAPDAFGRYYKLVFAIQNGDLDSARNLILKLTASVEDEATFSVLTFTEADLGEKQKLYRELIDFDSGDTPWILPPRTNGGAGKLVQEALELLDVADKTLADELRGLIVQIVVASANTAPNSREFGSVSSLMLWGLAMVNHDLYQTPEKMIQALVHEAAHLLLYAHSIEEPLVTNPIDARYLSPLREDPRPMDGVFHATFVIARLHYLTRKFHEATTSHFSPFPVSELDQRLVRARARFFGGVETIRRHGQLTQTGHRILEESLEYMAVA